MTSGCSPDPPPATHDLHNDGVYWEQGRRGIAPGAGDKPQGHARQAHGQTVSPAGGDRSINAVWTYEAPFEAMKQIKEYVAFYPDRVDKIS